MTTVDISRDTKKNFQVAQVILKDLPEWFGIAESTQSYVEAASHEICLIAIKDKVSALS